QIDYFLNFMIKILAESLNDIDIYRKKITALNSLSESSNKVLSCFKEHPELRLNTKRISTETKLPRRTVINALNTLLKIGLVQKYGKGAAVRYQLTF
ncbi:MAG: hypothetical protein ACK4M7_05295, partial [Burkholderiales bacterium]